MRKHPTRVVKNCYNNYGGEFTQKSRIINKVGLDKFEFTIDKNKD